MSIGAHEAAAPAAPATMPGPHEGPVERLIERFRPEAEHAGREAAVLGEDVRAAILDHRAGLFDLAGDVLGVLKLADPADAPLAGAAEGLLLKVVTAAGNAGKIYAAVRAAA